jgi:hypothetical protein
MCLIHDQVIHYITLQLFPGATACETIFVEAFVLPLRSRIVTVTLLSSTLGGSAGVPSKISAMAASLSPEEQQKVISEYRSLRQQLEALYNKLGVVDADRSEHEYV